MSKRLFFVFTIGFVPLFITALAISIVAQPWFIHYENGRTNFPFGFNNIPRKEGEKLALAGLRSILPWGNSETLSRLKLSNGDHAFTAREVHHMDDVRRLILMFLLITIICLLVLTLALIRYPSLLPLFLKGIYYGALLTLVLLALLFITMYFDFGLFFEYMHYPFFKGDSFMFDETATLIKIYPEEFWSDAAFFIGIFSFLVSIMVLIIRLAFF